MEFVENYFFEQMYLAGERAEEIEYLRNDPEYYSEENSEFSEAA